MNPTWLDFLSTGYGAAAIADDIHFAESAETFDQGICALKHLSVLSVTGSQARPFLQGQVTCNVNDINASQASLGAICSPQGKVLSSFLLLAAEHGYYLLLPSDLLMAVKERLQKYVLRADVRLADASDSLCLLGLLAPSPAVGRFAVSGELNASCVHFDNRRLLVTETERAIDIWTEQTRRRGFVPVDSTAWRYLDIVDGLPWLAAATSEQFTPQMLNLDKLGGVSFNKGCYTGQEVVARTHYLGKAKRQLFIAALESMALPAPGTVVADAAGLAVGKVLNAAQAHGSARVLGVLSSAVDGPLLTLPDLPNSTLTLTDDHG